MALVFKLLSALFFLITLPAHAADDEQNAIDPKAAEIAKKSAEFLASRSALSFKWFVSYDEVVEEREKITYLRSGNTLMVRDTGFAMYTERGETLRDYYWDGATVSVVSPNENWHASASYEGSFDSLVANVRDKTGAILPLWSMLSKSLPNDLLINVDSGAYLGTTLIAGRQVHHVVFSEKDEDWQIWVSTDEDTPVPIMLIGTEKGRTGWPQYRVYMSDWNLDPEFSEASFKFVPDENSTAITLPLLTDVTTRSSGD
ncbi:MAG: DUF2092 domain-containing protein [Pseudomonadota bacterium]